MNFNYCQSCFKKTPQTTDITRFCAHCGKPFINLASVPSTSSTLLRQIERQASDEQASDQEYRRRLIQRAESKKLNKLEFELDDDTELDDNNIPEEDVDRVPNIKGLKVDIDIPQQNAMSVRSLASERPRPIKPPDKHKKRTKQEKQAFLAEFQKGASALRK